MADSKTDPAAPRGLFARLGKAREKTPGAGGSARVGYSSAVSFRLRGGKASLEQAASQEDKAKGLFVAHPNGLMPRDPVAHPKPRPRLQGAAKPIFLCEEPAHKAEVDIAAFVEAVSAAYPQPRDPDVRPVLKARPKEAARPFVYLPGAPEGPPAEAEAAVQEETQPSWDAEAVQRAHTERELRAFHEFLDRMESVPLEALDRPLAEMDEKAEERRRQAAPLGKLPALYDPILDPVREPIQASAGEPVRVASAAGGEHVAPREAPPVPDEDRHIIQAVIEPLEPMAKPRFPQSPAELLPGGMPQRLSPSQRAHLKRPVTLRDRHGRIAPVTYSLNPRGED